MSPSQPFLLSSPLSATHGRRRKSRFTYKNLAQLATSSATCPLRVIAHIDLDAFYAQCEMVRLGVAEDQPLAVQQWQALHLHLSLVLLITYTRQALIAVNYPARNFGLTRHITITEAKKLCPNLIVQHVATWKEGEEKWAYHDDAAAHIGTHKVSLDPYRLESRRILACIKEVIPAKLQRVEKASVDEVFLDLSSQVHSTLLERYPELALPAPYDDVTENLPRPPTSALDWQADALVDLDTHETEEDDPDWDDIAMLIGSEIVRGVRAVIREKLNYTCSAGICYNKMVAKLGSAYRKPNQQTVVRSRAVQQFLSGFKFTKIRNLGGKLGDQIAAVFGTDAVKDLLPISIEALKQKLGDDTGSWVYHTIRGIDTSEVNSRTQIKSMLSAKSFRPSINTYEQAVRWLRIFVCDIYSRLLEEGVLENKRRPKTINLHHRQGGQTRSRQCHIPQGQIIDEASLFDLAKTLLSQIIQEGRVWPCANLSLSVGGFEDGITGNMGIGSYLVKGDEAKLLKTTMHYSENIPRTRPEKRQRLDVTGPTLQRLFKTDCIEEYDEDFGAEGQAEDNNVLKPKAFESAEKINMKSSARKVGREAPGNMAVNSARLHQQSISAYLCDSCSKPFDSAEGLQSHQDWHFAKALQEEDRNHASVSIQPQPGSISRKQKPAMLGKKTGVGSSSRIERGQSRLNFG
jgi:DNA polymerase eta